MNNIPQRTDGRYNRAAVLPVANAVIEMLEDVADKITVAGSVRRLKPTVKDVEIVVIPHDPHAYRARLDKLVLENQLRRAVYRDKNGRNSHRWGDKYRGVELAGVKVELFVADVHNYGVIWWLRTGPGDANQYAVSQCLPSGILMRDGYLQHDNRKLSVPDERTMFGYLRMPIVAPQHRELSIYRRASGRNQHREIPPFIYVDEPLPPKQTSLFNL